MRLCFNFSLIDGATMIQSSTSRLHAKIGTRKVTNFTKNKKIRVEFSCPFYGKSKGGVIFTERPVASPENKRYRGSPAASDLSNSALTFVPSHHRGNEMVVRPWIIMTCSGDGRVCRTPGAGLQPVYHTGPHAHFKQRRYPTTITICYGNGARRNKPTASGQISPDKIALRSDRPTENPYRVRAWWIASVL